MEADVKKRFDEIDKTQKAILKKLSDLESAIDGVDVSGQLYTLESAVREIREMVENR
jgi:hypothetical protein